MADGGRRGLNSDDMCDDGVHGRVGDVCSSGWYWKGMYDEVLSGGGMCTGGLSTDECRECDEITEGW